MYFMYNRGRKQSSPLRSKRKQKYATSQLVYVYCYSLPKPIVFLCIEFYIVIKYTLFNRRDSLSNAYK